MQAFIISQIIGYFVTIAIAYMFLKPANPAGFFICFTSGFVITGLITFYLKFM